MQIMYIDAPRAVLKKFLEVQDAESTAEAIEYVWEEAYWLGVEMAFKTIVGECDAWRESIV